MARGINENDLSKGACHNNGSSTPSETNGSIPSNGVLNGHSTFERYVPSVLNRHNTRRATPSLEETRAAAQVLFTQFCREHIQTDASNLELVLDDNEIPDEINTCIRNNARHMYDGYAEANLARFGRDLRRIAEQFEQSPERIAVRKKASEIDLKSIGYKGFREMLLELFLDGEISRERIMVLFFFCSDLAVRALVTETGKNVSQLFTWSIAFLLESICSWVQRQGGWGVVLGSYVPKLAITCFAVMGCMALAVYLKKSLFSSSSNIT